VLDLEECEWERTRIIWSVLTNGLFNVPKGSRVKPTDLIKLSYDKPAEVKLSPAEVSDDLIARVKRKDGGKQQHPRKNARVHKRKQR
jgi:hypothetical protein